MTPRTDMVAVASGTTVEAAIAKATERGLSRIPVTLCPGDPDGIIGAVHVKDLLAAFVRGRGADVIDRSMREVPVVPDSQRISKLLGDLKTGDMHLAVVVDEHGGVAGVVTLEDILEELVGEIQDEFDQHEPEVTIVGDGAIRADGRTEIGRINEALDVQLAGEFRTIGGCVFNGLGRVPAVGDTLDLDEPPLQLEVIRMHGHRIADVEIRLQPMGIIR